ncbi:hypothetical protein RB200_19780 [Streptomyces sp. PmtG]
MIADSVPAALSLAISAYAAASAPVLLLADVTRRDLIETPAGDRLLVEIVRARHTAADAPARTALSAAALLLVLSVRKGAVR